MTSSLMGAAADTNRLLSRLAGAMAAGDEKKMRQCIKLYLHSFSAKLVAVHEASRANTWSHLSMAELEKIAKELSPFVGTQEKVTLHAVVKKGQNQDYRPVMVFRLQHRALQTLVMKLLSVMSTSLDNQFFLKGRDKAIVAVCEHFKAGYRHSIEVDIAACYTSFDSEKIPGLLPLPKSVTERVILSTHYNLQPGNITPILGNDGSIPIDWQSDCPIGEFLSSARQGLPQGSRVSPVVAEMLLAQINKQMPSVGICLSYADNFLVMGKSKGDVLDMELALRSALSSHPAGPLTPKYSRYFPPGKVITFLGYDLCPQKFCSVAITPSQEALHKFQCRLDSDLMDVLKAKSALERKRKRDALKRYCRQWARAYPLWHGAKAHCAAALVMVSNTIEDAHFAFEQ